jgi:hypothetical protein
MAKGTGFRQFKSDEREIVQLQQNIESALTQLQTAPMLDGILLEALELTSGDNTITHKLGRKVRGYIVTRKSAAVDLYDKISTDTNLSKDFTLNSSGVATISLWVF